MNPNVPSSNDFNNLNNNFPNPYDPSTNNGINVSMTNNLPPQSETIKPEVKQNNPMDLGGNIFNQTPNNQYSDNMNQADNYNVSYNSRTQTTKPEKTNMMTKYLIFLGIVVVVGVIIYVVSTYVK